MNILIYLHIIHLILQSGDITDKDKSDCKASGNFGQVLTCDFSATHPALGNILS